MSAFPRTYSSKRLSRLTYFLKQGSRTLWKIFHLGGEALFFYPNNISYRSPEELWQQLDTVQLSSGNATLDALWLHANQPRGILLHCHGNAGNISCHMDFVHWLPPQGWSVLMFDYQGFGRSNGRPTRFNALQDTLAALDLASQHAQQNNLPLVVFGQSIGGAIAIAALAAGRHQAQALIIESSFADWRDIARDVLRSHWFIKPLLPLVPLLVSQRLSPEKAIATLRLPTLIMQSQLDSLVLPYHSKRLFQASAAQDKNHWLIADSSHLEPLLGDDSPWRKQCIDWLNQRTRP